MSRRRTPRPGVSHALASKSIRCVVGMQIGLACGPCVKRIMPPGTSYYDTRR
jgi:hypothetical protein